jgi:leucyl aminopeptidase
LTVDVVGPDEASDDLVSIGLPVRRGDEGPELAVAVPAGTPGVTGLPDADWARRRGFAGDSGQVLALGEPGEGPTTWAVGLGPAQEATPERWRRLGATFIRSAGDEGTAALVLSGAEGGPSTAAAVTEGAVLAAYRFDAFRSADPAPAIDRLMLVVADDERAEATAAVRRGERTARAVTWARDLVNTPPSDLAPRRLAELAVADLSGPQTTVDVWEADRIEAERLGGLGGVSRGSSEPPRLVWATYSPADPRPVDGHVPHVVLVGKGITFDSGGLSLKTPEGMTTMKTDMSGAAVVLAVLGACADLEVALRVSAIAPVTENMPGGRAIKPGDVLKIRNGSTIEVLNTDAEGRLVLADALSLASELEPDAIIDVATLTGAAVAALGNGIGALFGNDRDLVARLEAAGERAGEPLWPLPLPDAYRDHIDSDVADMKNIGKPGQAGAIVAALLLARFVKEVPWAHLDIAGPARVSEPSGYLTKGGTAFGVRTLIEFLSTYPAS